MTELYFRDYRMPAAALGEESALPDIHVNGYIRANVSVSDRIGGEDARYLGKGMISTLLPYRIQDGYGRERKMRTFHAAVLENEGMRAVFLPELGGRLWSLYDKRAGRELLYRNDVFQPANLALRNAWFSGGVEFNVGIKGHNPLTASPLFAARAVNRAGDAVLRMYEYERIRGVVFLIEATLGEGALYLNITVENPQDTAVPMYWWSNIAVPETPHTRILAPAKETFFCAYTDGGYFLDKAPLPMIDGRDVTYASTSPRSRDFFFDIPKERGKWVASADREGMGLLHVSDPLLLGRKLFVWGNHRGGRRWNAWLTEGAGPYVEIQAGLLKTQLEHFPMAANSRLSWQECYTALSLPPAVAHGALADATAAAEEIAAQRIATLTPARFDLVIREAPTLRGSGWGAFAARLAGRPISALCEFPEDSLGAEQADFLALLEGHLPPHAASEPPVSFAVDEPLRRCLAAIPDRSAYWENQLGVMHYAAGDTEAARGAFLASLAKEPSAWAERNLAMIEKNLDKNPAAAAVRMLRAQAMARDYRPLAIECAEVLLAAGRPRDVLALYEGLSEALRADGRLRMLLAAAYTELSMTDKARAILNERLTVPDIKEGEYALSAIWTRLYTRVLAALRGVEEESLDAATVLAEYPLPYALDYRMH